MVLVAENTDCPTELFLGNSLVDIGLSNDNTTNVIEESKNGQEHTFVVSEDNETNYSGRSANSNKESTHNGTNQERSTGETIEVEVESNKNIRSMCLSFKKNRVHNACGEICHFHDVISEIEESSAKDDVRFARTEEPNEDSDA